MSASSIEPVDIEAIRARTSQPITEIVANPREYYRMQQILRDRVGLLRVTDDLVRALTDAVNALSQLATSLQPDSPAQKLADEAGFKGSAMLASIGK